jgi:hypothetical protein
LSTQVLNILGTCQQVARLVASCLSFVR